MVLGAIVGVGFLLVVILIAYAVFQPVFAGLIDSATGFFTATQLKPKIGVDDIICDLRVKTFAKLDQTLPFSELFIRIDPNNTHDFNWFNCFQFSNFPNAQLIDLQFKNPQPLDFFTFGGETISGQIVLRDANDPTQKVDAFTQPQLKRSVLISEDAGIIPTPFNMDIEYVVTNIPKRDFTLEIYYGREIFTDRTLDVGKPIIAKICANGSKLC